MSVQVSFSGIPHSDAVEAHARELADRLFHFHDRITNARIVVASPHRHHRQGKLYSVRIDLAVPQKHIVVNRDHEEKHAHEDVYTALNDAFRIARRQLEDHARRLRGDVKHHETPPHGRVVRLFPDQGHGFIETASGEQLYFHANAVLDDGFGSLAIGTEVRYAESEGEEGPTASSVRAVGRHHHLPPG